MLEKGKKEDEGGRVESVRRVFFLFDLTQGTRQSRPTSGGFLFFPCHWAWYGNFGIGHLYYVDLVILHFTYYILYT